MIKFATSSDSLTRCVTFRRLCGLSCVRRIMAILLRVRMTRIPIVIILHAQDKIEMESAVVEVRILRYLDLLLKLVTQLRWVIL
jgi:hypothetical protein